MPDSLMNPPPSRRRLPYQQVVDRVESQIRARKFTTGDRLPPLKELSQEYGFNYATVRKGLMALRDRGLLNIRHGVGIFVAEHAELTSAQPIRLGLALRDYLLRADQHHPATGAILSGIYTANAYPRCQVDVISYTEGGFTGQVCPQLLERRYPGVLIPGGSLTAADYQFLKTHRIAFVETMNAPAERPDWGYWIVLDRRAALRRSLEHLYFLGHRRIALVQYVHMGRHDTSVQNFRQIACDLGLQDSENLLVQVNNPPGGVQWQDIDQLFRLDPPPTAAIVNDEILADVLLAECQRRQVDIPGKLAVVSLQDVLPNAHRVPLTVCFGAQAVRKMHQSATDLLVKIIQGQSPSTRFQTIAPDLVVKASSGSILPK